MTPAALARHAKYTQIGCAGAGLACVTMGFVNLAYGKPVMALAMAACSVAMLFCIGSLRRIRRENEGHG